MLQDLDGAVNNILPANYVAYIQEKSCLINLSDTYGQIRKNEKTSLLTKGRPADLLTIQTV